MYKKQVVVEYSKLKTLSNFLNIFKLIYVFDLKPHIFRFLNIVILINSDRKSSITWFNVFSFNIIEA